VKIEDYFYMGTLASGGRVNCEVASKSWGRGIAYLKPVLFGGLWDPDAATPA